MNDMQSLAHFKRRYHNHIVIVFALKYRRQEVYGKMKADMMLRGDERK